MAALEMKVQAKEDEKVTELVNSDTKITEERLKQSGNILATKNQIVSLEK